MKLLRGPTSENIAPVDCSLGAWKSRYRESIPEWKLLFSERQLPRSHWARMLAWDPHWIKRRPEAGWLKPETYLGACIYMGLVAFYELAGDEDFAKAVTQEYKDMAGQHLQNIKTRLAWLSHVVNGTQKPATLWNRKALTSLSTWTCLEATEQVEELKACYTPVFPSGGDEWVGYHNNRYILNMVRVFLRQEQIPSAVHSQVEEYKEVVEAIDHFTRFDFRAEALFLKLFSREQYDFKKSLERARVEYPAVILTPVY